MRAPTARRAGTVLLVALGLPLLAACGASVQTFEVGECLDLSRVVGEQETSSVPTVDCAEPHDGEVYAVHTYADGEFPGQTALATELERVCTDAFAGYVGVPYETSAYSVQLFVPSSDSWDRADDRDGACVLYTPDETRTDSGRGSSR